MKKKKVIYAALGAVIVLTAAVLVLAYNANRIIQYELRQFLGRGFSVEDISLGWSGVTAREIRMLRPDDKEVFKTKELDIRASIAGLLKDEKTVSLLTLDSPFLLIEFNSRGEFVFPMPNQKNKAVQSKTKKQEPGKSPSPVLLNESRIRNGSLDYLDRKMASPVLIKLREIDATFHDISLPPDNRTSGYDLKASVGGRSRKGVLSSAGTINLKTKDTKSKVIIRDLDLTLLRPYYEKKGDVQVTGGLLSLDSDITIRQEKISAAGKITIKDLTFEERGGNFLGLPLLAVTKLLRDNNNQIALDFTIEGDLKNPRFNLTQSLVQKLTLSLAKSLGMPIEAIGRSVFEMGGSALEKLFK